MRLKDFVRRDAKLGIRGISYILYVHKHRDTSPRGDEFGRAKYDEHKIMGSMTPGVPLTSRRRYIQLA